MAIAALANCLERFGEETLITALHCVTQTINNRPGVLTGRMIKALCVTLDEDRERRDRGLALLETFDEINLVDIQQDAAKISKEKGIRPVQVITGLLRIKLSEALSPKVKPAPSLPSPRSKIFVDHRTMLGARPGITFKRARRPDSTG